MDRNERMLVLSQLIKNIGPVQGEKCLQKLVYLLQEYGEPIGYNFTWNYYGPVSYDLDIDLDEAEALGIIKVSWHDKIPIYSSKLYQSNLSQFWQNKLKYAKLPSKIQEQLPKTKQLLSNCLSDPLLMEILASLVYLKRDNDGRSTDYVIEQLIELSNGRIDKKDVIDASHLLNQLF